MKTEEIKINKGQYLQDVYPLIETNVILNKRLSGIGATHCEIIAPRNSIIVVPNIPIISCKVEKHKDTDNLFGVMQNVTEREIEKYLKRTLEEKKWIKIMVTPESFFKIKKAFEELGINLYDSCFLMLDECHKFIKERNFRKEITQPFHSFFKFKNKALISATPIIPSDPRFEEQGFKLVKVSPQFYFLFDIMITPTDDIRRMFNEDFSGLTPEILPDVPYCFFINSASIIADFINQANLDEISSIFCSEISAIKLKDQGFSNVHTEWKEEYQKPLMFFTSRFYTGLDIWLDKKPIVIYFSDAKYADYTLMDPCTDMAQACGRFRNGMKQIYHYVNFNPNIEYKPTEDIENQISAYKKSYNVLQELYNTSSSIKEKDSILEIIKNIPYNEFFTNDEIDYFLKDYIIDYEGVKQLYTDFYTLREAYAQSGYFQPPWQNQARFFHFKGSNPVKLKKTRHKNFKRRQRVAITNTLEWLAPYRGTKVINEIINSFNSFDKLTVEAFFKCGAKFIRDNNFNSQKIKENLINKKTEDNPDEGFYETLLSTFEVGKKYLCSEAKEKLQSIYDKFNIIPLRKITAQSLKWHFEIDNKVRIRNDKAVKIIRPTAEGLVKYLSEIKNNTTTAASIGFKD